MRLQTCLAPVSTLIPWKKYHRAFAEEALCHQELPSSQTQASQEVPETELMGSVS